MSHPRPHVLVVDDRPANRYAIVHTLELAGFAVNEASNGQEALEFARQLPSVVLLDVKLPDMLGYEVCRRIKADPLTQNLPILQMSASLLGDESKVNALESGADAYLTHPIEPNVLLATVNSLVRLYQAESQARASARQWQATFDALREGVALVNQDGVVQRANRAMAVLLGYTNQALEDEPIYQMLAERLRLKIGPGIKTGPGESNRVWEAAAGGKYFRLSSQSVSLDQGDTGNILVLSEITEQKRATEAVLVSERLAATGRLANTIAHEINNPLESITNLLYLAHSSIGSSQPAASYIAAAEEQLSRVSRISRQILSFNRESSLPLQVALSEILEDVLALNNRALVEKNLRLRKEWDEPLLVRGFPAQLRQVFSNLLRNAIEASCNNAEIRVRISKCGMGSGKKCAVRVTISDQGCGIPEELKKQVFDAFFTTKELKGSGVGLWLSATIVQEHRGLIQLRSSTHPSKSGTCISVLLPCD